jgi:protein MAK11
MAKRKASSTGAAAAAPKASSSSKPQGKRARFDGPPPSNKKSSAPAPKLSKQAKKEAKIPKAVPTPAAPATFTVSAGSYERLLYGLSCTFEPVPSTSTGLPYTLTATPVFSFPAHLSSLKTVAGSLLPSPGTGSERKVGGKYLVSGGTDEVVKVWDLRRRKEVGTLEGDTAGKSVQRRPSRAKADRSRLFRQHHLPPLCRPTEYAPRRLHRVRHHSLPRS